MWTSRESSFLLFKTPQQRGLVKEKGLRGRGSINDGADISQTHRRGCGSSVVFQILSNPTVATFRQRSLQSHDHLTAGVIMILTVERRTEASA